MKTIAIFAFAAMAASATAQDQTFFKVNAERFEFENKNVTGAPYSAQALTETTQVLSDGNRIVRKTTSSIARDSMGRTRREQNLDFVGPWATAGKPSTLVLISDPVSGAAYALNSDSHTAIKTPIGADMEAKLKIATRAKLEAEHEASIKIATTASRQTTPKIDSLGTQTIGGLQAEGKRVTETIPAGKIGNERDINIVSETWYSPDLQTTVMSKNSDPRSGEVVYTLTNINRSEPDPTLFQIPSDYKIRDEEPHLMIQTKQP
jgi:hypothetical protein